MSTLRDRLNRCPPFLCRLAAHEGRRAFTNAEIAARSGLDPSTVSRLSRQSQWSGRETLATIDAFMAGCGINALSPGPQIEFLREAKKVGLRRYARRFRRLLAQITTTTSPLPECQAVSPGTISP